MRKIVYFLMMIVAAVNAKNTYSNEINVSEETGDVIDYEKESEVDETEEEIDTTQLTEYRLLNVSFSCYDLEQIVQLFLGEEYAEDMDEMSAWYSSGDLKLSVYGDCSSFSVINTELADPYHMAMTPLNVYRKYQPDFLEMAMPESAKEYESYEECREVCDQIAEELEFPYGNVRTYLIDDEFGSASWMYFGTPAPGKDMTDSAAGEWDQEDFAFLFLYEYEEIEGLAYRSLIEDGILSIIYSPARGLISLEAPVRYQVISEEMVDLISSEEAEEKWKELAFEIYQLVPDQMKITEIELVYTENTKQQNMIEGTSQLLPCWKLSFTDKESTIDLYAGEFPNRLRGEAEADGYMLLDAISGDINTFRMY
ncbi:MAG: hypothetical protein IJ468_04580 [Lachnospiraceae bacterium]|nr:hypothetical protein [Lachnospiraceae bacterium]